MFANCYGISNDQGAADARTDDNQVMNNYNNYSLLAIASKLLIKEKGRGGSGPNSTGFNVGVKIEPQLEWISSVISPKTSPSSDELNYNQAHFSSIWKVYRPSKFQQDAIANTSFLYYCYYYKNLVLTAKRII